MKRLFSVTILCLFLLISCGGNKIDGTWAVDGYDIRITFDGGSYTCEYDGTTKTGTYTLYEGDDAYTFMNTTEDEAREQFNDQDNEFMAMAIESDSGKSDTIAGFVGDGHAVVALGKARVVSATKE